VLIGGSPLAILQKGHKFHRGSPLAILQKGHKFHLKILPFPLVIPLLIAL